MLDLILLQAVLSCLQQQGVSWSETLAVSEIRERQPVVLRSGEAEPADRARTQVCLTVGGAGEVLAVRAECGDPVLSAAVTRSLQRWRFTPPEHDPTFGDSITTTLTFQWRDHRAALIWDRKEYPIGEADATKLVRAVPVVAKYLKGDRVLNLDVNSYPEERDGVFYLFHLYQDSDVMTFTLGWYYVNAYTGEVWDGLEFKPVRAPSVRRVRTGIRRRLRLGDSPFQGLDPSTKESDELVNNPCADRPRLPSKR